MTASTFGVVNVEACVMSGTRSVTKVAAKSAVSSRKTEEKICYLWTEPGRAPASSLYANPPIFLSNFRQESE